MLQAAAYDRRWGGQGGWGYGACAVSSGACATTNFSDSAFQSKHAPYEIPYQQRATHSLLAQPWRISNYSYDRRGATELTGGRFTTETMWESSSGSLAPITSTTYELLFQHTSNASIWVRRFEVVNLDQLEHDPNAPRSKVELVLVATPFSKRARGAAHTVPAYLLFGYINDAPMFDQQLADFRELVLRVRPRRSP